MTETASAQPASWKNRHRCRKLHKRLKSRDVRVGLGYHRDAVLWRYSLNGGHPKRQARSLNALAGRHTLEEVDPSPFFRSPYVAKNPFWEKPDALELDVVVRKSYD